MSGFKDWRLTNQEQYLQEAVLVWQTYAPANPENDHDHCEFCYAKFMLGGEAETLSEGYSTRDRHRWICNPCFDDFAVQFAWHIEGEA
jgi:hypothetical protein